MKKLKCHPHRKYFAKNLCKRCYERDYYKHHKNPILKSRKRYRNTHKNKIKKRSQLYYKKNKSKIDKYKQEYYQHNSDYVRAKAKHYYDTHREEQLKKGQIRRQKYPEVFRQRQLRYKYGISPKRFKKMLKAQNYKCYTCSVVHKEQKHERLQVDHNHVTGEIRKLLCNRCNSTLAFADENMKRLRNLILYITSYNGHHP